ncbi:hypothetical protein AAF712_012131 [Marasmius tenuissimus]|uniref:Uncharacterized protein n=1 Tax=Marasmius tenuissimus TaxID=585030 RepID=A0ABR2ZK08_9AGAR
MASWDLSDPNEAASKDDSTSTEDDFMDPITPLPPFSSEPDASKRTSTYHTPPSTPSTPSRYIRHAAQLKALGFFGDHTEYTPVSPNLSNNGNNPAPLSKGPGTISLQPIPPDRHSAQVDPSLQSRVSRHSRANPPPGGARPPGKLVTVFSEPQLVTENALSEITQDLQLHPATAVEPTKTGFWRGVWNRAKSYVL